MRIRLARRGVIARYAIAVGLVLAAVGARLAIASIWSTTLFTLLLFYPAIGAAAWFGRFAAGVVATALSALAIVWLFFEPHLELAVQGTGTLAAVLGFVILGIAISALMEALHRARARALRASVDRERSEQDLRASEAAFRAAFDASSIGVCEADGRSGRLLRVNRRLSEMTGYAAEALLGQTFCDLVHPDDRDQTTSAFRSLSRGDLAESRSESRLVRRDGRTIWANIVVNMVRDAAGVPLRAVALVQDVTDRRAALEELEALQRRLAADLEDTRHLHELGTRLLTDAELPEQLRNVLRACLQLMSASRGNIQVLDERTGTLAIAAQIGFDAAFMEAFASVRAGQAACGIAMRDRTRVIVEDVRTDPRLGDIALELASHGVLAVQSTPLIASDGTLLGVLSTHFDQPQHPTDRQLRLLDLFAQQAVRVVERERARERLAEQARQQEALFRLVDRLHRAETQRDVHVAAIDALLDALRCDRAAVLLLDDAGVMRFVEWTGLSDACRTAAEGHSPWAPDEAAPRPTWIDDVNATEPDAPLRAELEREGIGALRFIPLTTGGRLIGTIVVCYNAPRIAMPEEIDLALGIGRQLAFGIARTRAEEALRENEERLRLATATGKVGVWDWDITTDRVTWTDSLYTIHGVPRDGFGGTREAFADLVHPDDRDHVGGAIDAALHRDAPYELEFRAVRPDGETIWLFTSARVFRSGDGAPRRMVGATLDITALKRAEEAARASEARLAELIHGAMDAVVAIDADRRIVLFNPAAERMFGHSAADATGTPLDRYFRPAQAAAWRPDESDSRMRASHLETAGTLTGIRANGEAFPVEASISRSSNGPFVTLILRDVTERIQADTARERLLAREHELRRAAEAANRLKDEFLATLSHELRNPLNVILGYSEVLLRSEECQRSGRLRQIASTLRRSALSQSHLVRDLLDLSRLRSGKLTLAREIVSLGSALHAAVETVRGELEAKGVAIAIEEPADPLLVDGDPLRLEQIAWNLLHNAVKFTPVGGRIGVLLRRTRGSAELVVEDTGRGIDPAFLPHVFEMFRQEDQSDARRQSGMGIGLALVRQLVELHGGSVEAESEGVDRGARFTVRLSLSGEVARPTAEPREVRPLRLDRMDVLILDDSADAVEMLRELLELDGARVSTVTCGADGLAAASERAFDVVLSDLSMPGMDGFEFLRRLREIPGRDTLPVLALTGLGRPEDADRVRAAGFQALVVKPIDYHSLAEILRHVGSRASGRRRSSAASA